MIPQILFVHAINRIRWNSGIRATGLDRRDRGRSAATAVNRALSQTSLSRVGEKACRRRGNFYQRVQPEKREVIHNHTLSF
jgi:hypothetical protein